MQRQGRNGENLRTRGAMMHAAEEGAGTIAAS